MEIAIVIKCPSWEESVVSRISEILRIIIKNAETLEIIPFGLKEVIVTEDYFKEYGRIGEIFGLSKPLIKESEYYSVAKMCFNRNIESPEYILLLHNHIFSDEKLTDRINRLFLETITSDLLPTDLKVEKKFYYNTPVSQIAAIFFSGFFGSMYAQFRMQITESETLPPPS